MLSAAFDELYASGFTAAYGELGSVLSASEPRPLDILTIRPASDCFNSGKKALVTAKTPKTLVS